MSMYYAATWLDGNFDRTVSILKFYSKKARAQSRIQCAQRFEPITQKQAAKYDREGRIIRLITSDAIEA